VNTLSGGGGFSAEFRVFQGDILVARIAVGPSGEARMPWALEAPFQVRATAQINGVVYESNPLGLRDTLDTACAEVRMRQGMPCFQLVRPGPPPSLEPRLLVENTWREPILLHVWKEGTALSALLGVEAHATASFSTAREWQVSAIIHGVTTEPLRVEDPNATVSAVAGEGVDAHQLVLG
jgi:hypothetical protein